MAKDKSSSNGWMCYCLHSDGSKYIHALKPCCWVITLEIQHPGWHMESDWATTNPISSSHWQLFKILMCQYGELCVCCSGTKPLKVNRFFGNNLRSRVVLSRVVLTVIMLQVGGSIDDLLRRSGRSGRGCKEGLVLIYDTRAHGWSRGPDSPHMKNGAACTIVQC